MKCLKISILCSLFFVLFGCKPVERIELRTEYVNVLKYDSIYLRQTDSVYVERQGDTVRINSFKTLFKDRLKIQKDTIVHTDSVIFRTPPVQVNVPVEVKVPVRGFFWWIGLVALSTLVLYVLYKLYKLYKL